MLLLAALLLCSVLPTAAQELRVVSEFVRVAPDGSLLDKPPGYTPREILSPVIPRNAYSSFRILVSGQPGLPYRLFVGLNPENAVGVTVYRETYEKDAAGKHQLKSLTPVELPESTTLPQGEGEVTASYWLDLWAERNARIARIKVEPALGIDARWIIYPMEVRVVEATVPTSLRNALVKKVPAEQDALRLWRQYLCGATGNKTPFAAINPIARNAVQDVELARQLEPQRNRAAVLAIAAKGFGLTTPEAFCAADATLEPERLLRVRQLLYGALGKVP